VLEVWPPPAEGERLRTGGERVLYPHDLREGKHGFTPLSCVGSQVLAALDSDEGMAYLLDLGALKGRHVVLGSFNSPDTIVQPVLF
jgi:hypothetical protein